jgi:hypothetical protein
MGWLWSHGGAPAAARLARRQALRLPPPARVHGEGTRSWLVGGIESDRGPGNVTGTQDKHYNIIWFTEACLSNALRLEGYVQDAERSGDKELAEFFH